MLTMSDQGSEPPEVRERPLIDFPLLLKIQVSAVWLSGNQVLSSLEIPGPIPAATAMHLNV